MMPYKILSTKILEPSLADQARRQGMVLLEQAFIDVRPIATEQKRAEVGQWMQSPVSCMAFTSASAVAALKDLVPAETMQAKEWRIFCLAGKTGESLGAVHGRIVADAEDAASLAQKILDQDVHEILFFCGDQRRDTLPLLLQQGGLRVHEVVVYETVAAPAAAPQDLDGVLFFSPSAVHSFFSANQLGKRTVCFAIGATTAASIAERTGNRIITSQYPSQEMMLAAVNFYFDHLNPYE